MNSRSIQYFRRQKAAKRKSQRRKKNLQYIQQLIRSANFVIKSIADTKQALEKFGATVRNDDAVDATRYMIDQLKNNISHNAIKTSNPNEQQN